MIQRKPGDLLVPTTRWLDQRDQSDAVMLWVCCSSSTWNDMGVVSGFGRMGANAPGTVEWAGKILAGATTVLA